MLFPVDTWMATCANFYLEYECVPAQLYLLLPQPQLLLCLLILNAHPHPPIWNPTNKVARIKSWIKQNWSNYIFQILLRKSEWVFRVFKSIMLIKYSQAKADLSLAQLSPCKLYFCCRCWMHHWTFQYISLLGNHSAKPPWSWSGAYSCPSPSYLTLSVSADLLTSWHTLGFSTSWAVLESNSTS